MTDFVIEAQFHAPASKLYHAWLDSKLHTAMTGGNATCTRDAGGTFTAWDGYISGKNLELIPTRLIRQQWRTTDFLPDDPPSEITLTLEDTDEGCTLKLTHRHIPANQPDYRQGWEDHYFTPMRAYFKPNVL